MPDKVHLVGRSLGGVDVAQALADSRLVGRVDAVVQAIEEGAMKRSHLPPVFIEYLAPSIDTTVSAIAAALWRFARNPDQWQILQRDPARIPHAVNEVGRMESAVRAFGRRAERDTEIEGDSNSGRLTGAGHVRVGESR